MPRYCAQVHFEFTDETFKDAHLNVLNAILKGTYSNLEVHQIEVYSVPEEGDEKKYSGGAPFTE